MKFVSLLALLVIALGGYLSTRGSGIGLAAAIASSWFLLPSLLYPIARGSRYYVTNRRVVREKLPFLQQLEFQEIGRVRTPIFIPMSILGLWTLYFYPKDRLHTYYVVFSYLDRGDTGKVKRIFEEAKGGFTSSNP